MIVLFAFSLVFFSLGNADDVITVKAVLGENAELPCNVTAVNEDDNLNILAWYRDGSSTAFYSSRDLRGGSGNVMSPSPRYRLLTSEEEGLDTLEILTIIPSDAGIYHCHADFSKSPTRKSHVLLVVIEPPQKLWIIHENGTRVATANAGSNTSRNIGPYYIGDTIDLICVAFGGKPQPRLSWWSEQQLLKNTSTVLSELRVRSDLHFGPLSREHHGRIFTCFAQNNDETPPLSIDISIDMYLPPELVSIHVGDKDSVFGGRARAGEVLTMECRVFFARPLPTVTWRINESKLTTPEQNTIVEPTQQRLVNEIRLNVTPEFDESRITCCVPAYRRDSEDYICALAQHLSVQYRPVVNIEVIGETVENDTLSIVKGSNVSMNCSFEANPAVFRMIWFHKDDILSESTDEEVSPTQKLDLVSVSEDESGEYACSVTNDEGFTYSKPVVIDVVYPPYCEDESVVEYGVASEECINITCKVKANPPPTAYRWLLVSEVEGTKLHTNQSQTLETDDDTLMYQRPNCTTTLVYCWGLNSVKSSDLLQTKCTFLVTDETVPQPPSNCEAIKDMQGDITVTCRAGHNGGLPQKFKFIVTAADSEEQLVSIINQEPKFMIEEPKETTYKFNIIAFNDKGESKIIELDKDSIIDEGIDPALTISAVTNITTLALSLCGGVALLALIACGLVLCAHDRQQRHDLPRDSHPPLCAYTTDESNCETCNDSDEGSECNIRRTESFRRAIAKYPPKNYDMRRTSSFHSARYMRDMSEPEPKCIQTRRTNCRVHSLQNISRKREMDSLCDHLVMHLPPEPSYNVPKPMNTFYTMPRKTRHRSQKEVSDETSEITQASDGFSLPPPPDEFGTYRAASRIKDIPIKSIPTYTTIIRQNSGKNLNKYGAMSPMNTVGLPSISGQPSLYTYPDDEQVKKNPFDDVS
ncbi:neural cell adhesion molecule 2-like isoform X1 [Pieris napi]|uniref:neural cell adhesion molecule 2-like isoform X1 n=1 Tax=Pieris napi TaxID=78633 RepID=UPI001FB96606|nr:neural cell adhesion molecule 2-like isoform X1 [Pieris napi]